MPVDSESVILPNQALFLVHKIGYDKSHEQTSRWQTRSLPSRTSSTSRHNIPRSAQQQQEVHRDEAAAPPLHFVNYGSRDTNVWLRKRHQGTLKPGRSNAASRQPGSDAKHVPTEPSLILPSDDALLNVAVTALPFTLPPSLVRRTVLYTNFFIHTIAANAFPHSRFLLFNPATKNWFPSMAADLVWFYIILAIAADSFASVSGNRIGSLDACTLIDEALPKLHRRIAKDGMPTDETLGAVSCLAMWSNTLGDKQAAWSHARGLAEMIRLRGGLVKIPQKLRSKVYRGILEVAVDSGGIPLVTYDTSFRLGAEQSPTLTSQILEVNRCTVEVHPDLVSIFCDTRRLTETLQGHAINGANMDPDCIDEAVFALQHRLLTLNVGDTRRCDDAFRFGLLIYLSSIIRPVDMLITTSYGLVSKLQASLRECVPSTNSLTRWKLLMGCMTTARGTPEKRWFMAALAQSCSKEVIDGDAGWDSFHQSLKDILWIEAIHAEAGKRAWSEVFVC